MENWKKVGAFTLVELIIVITIIAILATISFITLGDYPLKARDGVRKADMNNMKKALSLHKIKHGKYPLPSDSSTGSVEGFSGEIWTIGKFGSGVVDKLSALTEVPIDPKTKSGYTYSVGPGQTNYQISMTFEETGQDFIAFGRKGTSGSAGGGNENITIQPPLAPLRTCEGSGGLSFGFVNNTSKGSTGVVKDNNTGLMWESEGSNGETTTTMNWIQAKARCANLTKGGFTDWRLPDITELRSIVNYSCYNPAVNTAYFSLANTLYWSSTTYAHNTSNAWVLSFYHGNDNYYSKSDNRFYVLCVR